MTIALQYLLSKLTDPFFWLTIIFGLWLGFVSFQLNGITFIKDIPLIGQYAWQGYKPLYAKDEDMLKTANANQSTLKNAVLVCNASVAALKLKSDADSAKAQSAQDKAKSAADAMRALGAKVAAMKPLSGSCSAVDAVIDEALQ